jgi:hypothetical protein
LNGVHFRLIFKGDINQVVLEIAVADGGTGVLQTAYEKAFQTR